MKYYKVKYKNLRNNKIHEVKRCSCYKLNLISEDPQNQILQTIAVEEKVFANVISRSGNKMQIEVRLGDIFYDDGKWKYVMIGGTPVFNTREEAEAFRDNID